MNDPSNRTANDLYDLWTASESSQSAMTSNNANPNLAVLPNAQALQYDSNPYSFTAPTFPLPPSSTTATTNTMASAAIAQRTSTTLPTPSPLLMNFNQSPPTTSTSTSSTSSTTRVLGERDIFLIFVKVLFKCIERTDNGRLRQRAKAVVTECTRRNRSGDVSYAPLQEAVESRLKGVVGDDHWNQAKVFTGYYCQQKGLRTSVSV